MAGEEDAGGHSCAAARTGLCASGAGQATRRRKKVCLVRRRFLMTRLSGVSVRCSACVDLFLQPLWRRDFGGVLLGSCYLRLYILRGTGRGSSRC